MSINPIKSSLILFASMVVVVCLPVTVQGQKRRLPTGGRFGDCGGRAFVSPACRAQSFQQN